jgi:hypothetical protein
VLTVTPRFAGSVPTREKVCGRGLNSAQDDVVLIWISAAVLTPPWIEPHYDDGWGYWRWQALRPGEKLEIAVQGTLAWATW